MKPNRTAPNVPSPPTRLMLPPMPTNEDLTRARIFSEPLVPMSRATSRGENAALARAIMTYADSHRSEAVAPLLQFLLRFPRSAWGPSLLANLGTVYRANGYLSHALAVWDEAWEEARGETQPRRRAVADFALGEFLDLSSKLGHEDEMAARLEEAKGRRMRGRAAQKVAMAREALWILTYHHEEAQASGPAALESILAFNARATPRGRYTPSSILSAYRAMPAGTSLVELRTLAKSVGLSWEMAFRPANRPIPVPSIVHWRVNHYSAIVQQAGTRYLLLDPILGGEHWVSRDMLNEESSGYFLVPKETLGQGWRAVSEAEGQTVIGHCAPGAPDDSDPGPPETAAGNHGASGGGAGAGGAGGNGGGCGMAGYSFLMMPASLRITDTPVSCHSPVGPHSAFRVTYNQRDSAGSQLFSYGNLGPKWTFDWLSWVMDDPNSGDVAAHVFLRGGGAEHYTSAVNGVYPPHWRSRAVLVKVSADPVRYERRLPDGGVEVFSQSDGVITSGRKVFLTDIIDPQGLSLHLTYDTNLRLVAVTDAIGLVTTLSYDLPDDPLKITKVTDPYGRFATLTYNTDGELASITDVIGMTSSFGYGPGDFITRLTTPYGSTVFVHETDPTQTNYSRFLQATDPLGGTERVEFRWSTTDVAATESVGVVPAGFSDYNNSLDHYNSFYWNKRAMALYPDPAKATITHWLMYVYEEYLPIPYAHAFSTSVPHSIKRPLENRLWYAYADEPTNGTVGSWREPTMVGRVLDDGSSQIWQATYNGQGHVTSRTDPLGRQTSETYDTNGIDLLAVRRTTSGLNDLLASFANYTTGHLPQTVNDAAGQSTTYTYNGLGEVLTRTNAKNEKTTYAYDANGYLQSESGPDPAATVTYAYDAYGRVHTETDPDGYVRTFDYDALDRPTRITYPDGTADSVTYDKLDVMQRHDRLGRTTRVFHDALGRPVSVRDPLGRTTTEVWCACGTLDKLIDAKGHATSWQYDVQNRVTQEVRANGITATAYHYEATTSRLTSLTDPKGQVKTYTYALDDRLTAIAYSQTDQPTASVSFVYDSAYPRLTSMTDGTGVTTYGYVAAGTLGGTELASVDGPLTDDTITYGHDELGRVASRAVNGVTANWGYDNLGRLTSEANPLGTFTYTYDGGTARVASATYPSGQTSAYAYLDNPHDRRLQTIQHKAPSGTTLSEFDYTYNAVGDILTWQQQADAAAPTAWTYGYDAADQLTRAVKTTADQTVLARDAYVYDLAGNRTSEQVGDVVTGATYDPLNRLTAHTASGTLRVAGTVSEPATVTVNGAPATVDATNNFVASVSLASGTNELTVTATDPSGNGASQTYQVDASGATASYTYDANGNLISDGTRAFAWDGENRLVTVTVGHHESDFSYDGLGRRVRIVEKDSGSITRDAQFIWDGTAIVEERLSTGEVNRFFGAGEQLNGAARYITRDHLGSVREVTDATGAIVTRNDYDPYGRLTRVAGTEDSRFGFGGYYVHGPTGIGLTLHRAYDSEIGRWLNEDPIRMGGGLNLYRYVGGDPANYVDPRGTDPIVGWAIGAIGGAVYGALGGYMSGGGLKAMGVGALTGAITGATIGLVDPTLGLGTVATLGVLASTEGNIIGQVLSNRGFAHFNPGNTIGAAIGGGLGAAGGAWLLEQAGILGLSALPTTISTTAITAPVSVIPPIVGERVWSVLTGNKHCDGQQ